MEYRYEINFSVSFWGKDASDSYFPGEDKVWLDVWLDERSEDDFGTVDCDGIELPVEFLAWPREKREELLPELLEKAVPIAAELLDRNGIVDYEVHADVDVMDIDYSH